MTDEVLSGGGVTPVVRRGDAVHRTRGPHSDRVAALLVHLRERGFRAAPRYLGLDEVGREVLAYLPGEVGRYPLPQRLRDERAVISAARLLREYHDHTADVARSWPGGWMLPEREPVEVICHGDFGPHNCVYDDGRVVGIIDFDTAHPGPRAWDIAYALYRFAPLSRAPEGGGEPIERQAARARQFCDGYGPFDRTGLVGLVADRLRALVAFMRTEADRGNAAFAGHMADGHDRLYLRDIDYVEANADLLTRTLSG